MRSWVRQQPDLTLVELQERVWETVRLQVSLARLWQVLLLKLRLKKSLHAQEQDSPENRQRRQAWGETVNRIEPDRLVFVDESEATTEMTRR